MYAVWRLPGPVDSGVPISLTIAAEVLWQNVNGQRVRLTMLD
jgi:hypothetical protein